MNDFINALLLSAGYNAALVAIGAALLGLSAGAAGTFLFLRKRALVCDAVAHATLPGVGLAFIIMVILGADGRNLAGLLTGSAITASAGLLAVAWIVKSTRLTADAAIGSILSVFFGFGIVLLTVIQTMPEGRQAGLEVFLLGATAAMLLEDAIIIAAGGALAVAIIFFLRRPMTLVAFDADYAASAGYNVNRIDFAMMLLVMAVTVIGLKIVGLILIVALLIIPAATARFWTKRSELLLWSAGVFGAVAGYVGAALSAAVPALPTGPIIVLVSAVMFVFSLFFAPARGVLASFYRYWRFQKRVHLRQGLLAMARSETIHDTLTLSTLRRAGFMRADGVATPAGQAQAARTARDERRWRVARRIHQDETLTSRYDGLTPIESVFTRDEIADFDRRISETDTMTIYRI